MLLAPGGCRLGSWACGLITPTCKAAFQSSCPTCTWPSRPPEDTGACTELPWLVQDTLPPRTLSHAQLSVRRG